MAHMDACEYTSIHQPRQWTQFWKDHCSKHDQVIKPCVLAYQLDLWNFSFPRSVNLIAINFFFSVILFNCQFFFFFMGNRYPFSKTNKINKKKNSAWTRLHQKKDQWTMQKIKTIFNSFVESSSSHKHTHSGKMAKRKLSFSWRQS